MTSNKVLVEQIEGVGIIRLNDPDRLNALTAEMVEELDEAFDRCAGSCRAILLTSVGRAFSSGVNLAGGQPIEDKNGKIDLGLFLEKHVNPLISRLAELPIPWVSGVRGAAAGVGCSLALSADLIVASESAYFLQAFAKVGLVPDGGASWLLARSVGRPRALELMLLGERLDADKALQWGLINRLVADDQLESASLELAFALAGGPTKTLAMIRQLARKGAEGDLAGLLAAEREAQRRCGLTHDAIEGVTAFLEKRPARFIGS